MENNNKGLPNGYNQLTEYNGYVLAEKDFEHSESKKQYVTWMRNDRGFTLGHYFTDKTAAEEDFAIRTRLINSNKLFNADELAIIHSVVMGYYENTPINSSDENLIKHFKGIKNKLEYSCEDSRMKYIKNIEKIIKEHKPTCKKEVNIER